MRGIKTVTIVGAGLAGHASARALRRQGFDGAITIIGDEAHRPYDRPPLTKEFLAGAIDEEELSLEAEGEDLGADWLLGTRAIGLDPAQRLVTLAGGATLRSDVVILATGSSARTFSELPPGAHILRTLEEATALKAELVPGARLVVVGSGFIGLEVASTARGLGLDVTVLGSSDTPLCRTLGHDVGVAVQQLQRSHGIVIRNNAPVAAIRGSERVTGVELVSGEVVPADVVVVGIGSIPSVSWLAGSGLELPDGVACGEFGATSAPGVIAVGDCCAWFDPIRGRHHRVAHWTDSRERPVAAVHALLTGQPPARPLRPSYVWSDQCGSRIQFAGRLLGGEEPVTEAGSLESGDLFQVFRRAGEPVAVVGINQQHLVATWTKRLAAAAARTQRMPEQALA
ncbi:NAD(P)/FAD-dependent oxidoreductase [Rathayibacter soli]|uniref:NAD(P)/FAD-dependent oxidoreductase n=1 Tax=Rathayibacter soli TaxID=3144168 RepID=UPI0027E4FCDA|nr:FAD-dependent oxidoreductase [Glaciibacter superstes]